MQLQGEKQRERERQAQLNRSSLQPSLVPRRTLSSEERVSEEASYYVEPFELRLMQLHSSLHYQIQTLGLGIYVYDVHNTPYVQQ